MNTVIYKENTMGNISSKVNEDPGVRKPVFDVLKRIFDVVASLAALVALSPLMLLIIIAVVIEDFGSPFFSQERIGKDGKPFMIHKFRSMQKNAEEIKEQLMKQNNCNGANFKMDHDPRITKVGNILRKTSLDELPQLINILKGDMSIIGPRPFIPSEQKDLPDDRLLVRPGLSCYWQISGKNGLTTEQQIELDRKYISERSVTVDVKIILKTVVVVVTGKNN